MRYDAKGNIVWTWQEWEEYQKQCNAAGYTGRISGVVVEWKPEPGSQSSEAK